MLPQHNVRPVAGYAGVSSFNMTGDNPASDIAGAIAAGPQWRSFLVRTGVHQGAGNSAAHPATAVVDTVMDAVAAAMHRDREARWHAFR
jgi:ribonucleotide monophosphatase NagD (HAD superfamily)